MAYAYKKLIIKTNAIVPKGAMKTKAVYKEEDGTFLKVEPKLFKDDAKLEVTACLVKYGEFDSQDMILDDENVRDETMVNFLMKGNKAIKILHKTEDDKENYIEAYLKEIYVAKEDNVVDAPAGSILTTYKFKNAEDWKIAKELELEFSFEGEAKLVEVAKEDVPVTKEALKNYIAKNKEVFEQYFGKETIEKVVNKSDKKDDKKDDKTKDKSGLEKEVSELKKSLETVLKSQKELQKTLSQRITSISIDKEDEEEKEIDVNKIEL